MATKKEIRSKYIRNLVEDAASTGERIEDYTKEAVEQLLESTINKSLRNLISEQAEDEKDDKKEEESNTDNFSEKEEETTNQDETETETGLEDIIDTEDGKEEDTVEVDSEEEPAAEDGEWESDWTEFDKFKDEDGEYDLTGQDDETVYKVLMAMDPEKDGIRLVKTGEGQFTLTDDNTDKEYVIDLECEDGKCEPEAQEVSELDEDLGYTDNYQNQTAMTTPDNHEPGKEVRTWDKGIPTGTEKPWVGNGAKEKGHPYDDKVNECGDNCNMEECDKLYEIEMEVDDDMDISMDEGTSIANGSRVKGVKGDTNHSTDDQQRHVHKSYDRIMNEAQMSNLKRKASAILAENKELKGFATKINQKLRESAVINASLAKVVKLMTENSTTKEEKDNIVNRFSSVTTIDECNKLYETISDELKSRKGTNGTRIPSDKPLTESKNNSAKETKMLDSSEASDVLSFMERLNKVK